MATVFDGPMSTVGGEYFFGFGLIGRPTVDAIGDFTGDLAGFFADGFPFDNESLADLREVQIIVEFGCDPDFAGIDATMTEGWRLDKIRFSSIPKENLNGFKETGLVAFDGEVIMGLSCKDVFGDVALGQQSVSGDGFALNGDGVEQGDGRFDFVGTSGFIVSGYWE